MGKLKFFDWENFFSPLCFFCSSWSDSSGCCSDCWKRSIAEQVPQNCEGVLSLFIYDGWFKKQILQFKTSRHYFFYRFWARVIQESAILKDISYDVIVLAPCSYYRLRNEGIDHLLLIGKALAQSGCSVVSPFFKKGDSQKKLNREQRHQMQGVFLKSSFHFDNLKGAKVLFIDDIVTTGSTFRQMEKILLSCISDLVIYKFALARVKLKNRIS